MVGHDIRNPLQALAGEVYLIKTDLAELPKPEVQREIDESLEAIEQNIGYINKIIADLQDYSRQLYPEFRQVDLAALIDDVMATIVLPQNVALSLDIANVPEMRVDPTFTRRALTNLINNAIQAMPQGGELRIEAHQEQNSVLITVADTGSGIPDEVKGKLFTPMFTTKAKGQGLGLAVVKRLVEAEGGVVSFESELGKGTKFTIKLPL
jgi:signal transduction histidine kinase